MRIKSVSLSCFRNLDKVNIRLGENKNIFYGDNAQGKTSFLEAVYFCATGRSMKGNSDKELIKLDKNEAHIQIYAGDEKNEKYSNRLDVHLKRDAKKGIAVNGIAVKKLSDLFGALYIVIFSPEDLSLIKAGPSERRRFMDMELCQLSPVYYYDLQQYYKILKQRNNLLKAIKKTYPHDNALLSTISVWDEQLSGYGAKIYTKRKEFISKINGIASGIHSDITGGTEKLEIIYKPDISPDEFFKKLSKTLEKDVFSGSTGAGVHKDDILFYINGSNSKIYGSQGQQRTASLSAKLSEIFLIKEEKCQTPVLLLDDVLSELDKKRQNYLFSVIDNIQALITCTGMEDVTKNINGFEQSRIFYVSGGDIAEV